MPTDNNLAERIAGLKHTAELAQRLDQPPVALTAKKSAFFDFQLLATPTNVLALLAHVEQLEREVAGLNERWNTRFNTLCGLCGKRYLGPRDEDKHGYGRCDLAQHTATEGRGEG